MRARIANHSAALAAGHAAGHQQHQFSQVMQRIVRQTEVLLQRRVPHGAEADRASLDGLEVRESSWDEWSEVVADQDRGR